jgi:hypothetical protein
VKDRLFLEQVKAQRGTMSQRAFAESLGISESHWSKVRRGLAGMGLRAQMRALRRYPALIGFIGEDARGGE